ncbi:MAG: ribonuclease R, partial [Hyphomicrobium sp.]
SEDEILQFLHGSDRKVGKKDIARYFKIMGTEKHALKKLLARMTANGHLSGKKNDLRPRGTLPNITTLEITGRDQNGDLIAKPLSWNAQERPCPRILLRDRKSNTHLFKKNSAALGVGDHVIARLIKKKDCGGDPFEYEAQTVKKIPRESRTLLGIFRAKGTELGLIDPINRKELKSWDLDKGKLGGGAKDGDLVRFELIRTGRHSSPKARITENLGNPNEEGKVSLIAIHAHGIPDNFPAVVLDELNSINNPHLEERVDLTEKPLITIDPVDARDHDDAVFAEPDPSPHNPNGYIITVAIADVAYYVKHGTQLDREARLRGNSVYFPDRVVPMLPPRISNELCSLREKEQRPCLAVKMIFDQFGEKRSHVFQRAKMRSAARLSYDQVQRSMEGNIDPKCAPLMEKVLQPLWNAYAALKAAREKRGPLDLDLPERKILLNSEGKIERIYIPERLEAHRLIEEMMIQANVAAAETLETKNLPFLYRIHDQPSPEKLKNLRQFLETQNLKIPPYGKVKSHNFNHVLFVAKSLSAPELIHEIVLRSQSQAEYHPNNIGHFGLNLPKYAHFTSPIRRYADLVVHRALIRGLNLGEGGLEDEEIDRLGDLAQLISDTERRAMAAERETLDRLISMHLAQHIGCEFLAQISGVTRAGLFVRLKETGADGFIPMSTLDRDYFLYVPEEHALVGSSSGQMFRLGDKISVRLVEAIPTAGALRFEMLSGDSPSIRPLKLNGRKSRSLIQKRRHIRGHR